MVINVREMLVTGNTTYNIALQNNDIIYVPPTFLGHIARLIEKLLEPLNVAVQSLFDDIADADNDTLTFSAVGPLPSGMDGIEFQDTSQPLKSSVALPAPSSPCLW